MTKIPTISTKTGDSGETSLWSGERVPKNHLAIKCLSELDLFDSNIGLGYKYLENYKEITKTLNKIQKRFVLLKGEIATHPRSINEFYKSFKPISSKDVEDLDRWCDNIKKSLEESNYEIKGWVKYGDEGEPSAYFDFLRAYCRKCEIAIYDLDDTIVSSKISKNIKSYINRLSDYLYLIARYIR